MLNKVMSEPVSGVEDTAEDSVNESQVTVQIDETKTASAAREAKSDKPNTQSRSVKESAAPKEPNQTVTSDNARMGSATTASEASPVVLSEVDSLLADLKAVGLLYKKDENIAKSEHVKLIEKAATLSEQNFKLFVERVNEAAALKAITKDLAYRTIEAVKMHKSNKDNAAEQASQPNADNTPPSQQSPSASEALGAAGMALGSGVAGLFNGVRNGFNRNKGAELNKPEIELDEPEIERGAIESIIHKSGEAVMVANADMKLMRAGNAVERNRKEVNKQMQRLNQHLEANNISLTDLEGGAIKTTIDKLDIVEGTKVYNAYCDASTAMAKFMKSCEKSEAIANKISNNTNTPEPLLKLCEESVGKTLVAANDMKENYGDMPMNRINEELNYSFRSDLYGAMKALKIGRLENGEFDLSGVTGERMKKCVNALGDFKDSVVNYVLGPENAPEESEEVDVVAEKTAWGAAFKERWDNTKKKTSELKAELSTGVRNFADATKDQAATAGSYIRDGKKRALELYDDFKETASERFVAARESLGKMLDGLIEKLQGLWDNITGKSNKNEQATELNVDSAQTLTR